VEKLKTLCGFVDDDLCDDDGKPLTLKELKELLATHIDTQLDVVTNQYEAAIAQAVEPPVPDIRRRSEQAVAAAAPPTVLPAQLQPSPVSPAAMLSVSQPRAKVARVIAKTKQAKRQSKASKKSPKPHQSQIDPVCKFTEAGKSAACSGKALQRRIRRPRKMFDL
jgi:hypothetical protein